MYKIQKHSNSQHKRLYSEGDCRCPRRQNASGYSPFSPNKCSLSSRYRNTILFNYPESEHGQEELEDGFKCRLVRFINKAGRQIWSANQSRNQGQRKGQAMCKQRSDSRAESEIQDPDNETKSKAEYQHVNKGLVRSHSAHGALRENVQSHECQSDHPGRECNQEQVCMIRTPGYVRKCYHYIMKLKSKKS